MNATETTITFRELGVAIEANARLSVISILYFGRRYSARVRRSPGRTAIVSFTTKGGRRVENRRIRPERGAHFVAVHTAALDFLTRRYTAFSSFEELLQAKGDRGGFRPTLGPEFWPTVLAEHFDRACERRGYNRKAYRLGARKVAR